MKMVRRGSCDAAAAAALAGARRVAVGTGSRHCCVGNQATAAAAVAAAAAAALRLQCRESETSPSRRAHGTLRHSKATAGLSAPPAACVHRLSG